MKRIVLAAIASSLFACGGGGAPALHSFTYGTPTTPSATQASTASDAQSSLQSVAGVGGSSSAPTSAPTLTDELTSALPQSGTALFAPLPTAAQPQAQAAGQDGALRAMRSAGLSVGNSNCVSQTATSVTYNNCTYNGDGYNGTLNGSISVSSQQVTWDITWTIAGSSQGVTVNGSFKWSGQLAWTSSTIKGYGRSEYVVNGSANGQSYDLAYTAGFDVDVTYISSPSYCIATGTLELRRVVSGSTASQAGMHDAAWKFTWSGDGQSCGTVTVASGH